MVSVWKIHKNATSPSKAMTTLFFIGVVQWFGVFKEFDVLRLYIFYMVNNR